MLNDDAEKSNLLLVLAEYFPQWSNFDSTSGRLSESNGHIESTFMSALHEMEVLHAVNVTQGK